MDDYSALQKMIQITIHVFVDCIDTSILVPIEEIVYETTTYFLMMIAENHQDDDRQQLDNEKRR